MTPAAAKRGQVLVAGVGNVFLGDDGFGSEVAQRLARSPAVEGIEIRDFGIGAVDLLYDLERTEYLVLVDAVTRGGVPGTLYVLDPSGEEGGDLEAHGGADSSRNSGAHGLLAAEVVRLAARRARNGGLPRTMRIVGCEPRSFGEPEGRLGLSDEVTGALDRAVALVMEVAMGLLKEAAR